MKKHKMRYGVLAYPAKHSLSPVMFNAAFGDMEIDAEYEVFEIEEEKLKGFMKKMRGGNGDSKNVAGANERGDMEESKEGVAGANEKGGVKKSKEGVAQGYEEDCDWGGLSVSLPYKEIVMRFLDEIDEGARAIGAVNTVWNDEGVLRGYNTDCVGARRALEEACVNNLDGWGNSDEGGGKSGWSRENKFLEGKKVVVMGAGGAVRGIVYGLQEAGAEVEVYNRTLAKAETVGRDFGVKFGDLEAMKSAKGDVFIQATSIWLQNPVLNPGASTSNANEVDEIFPDEFLNRFECVMDIVYKPLKTPLLKKAEKLGKVIVTGEKMLLYQAIEQFRIWTGKEERDLPTEVMKKSLKGALNKALV